MSCVPVDTFARGYGKAGAARRRRVGRRFLRASQLGAPGPGRPRPV